MHDAVIHSKGQFSKRNRKKENVSTNAVEGLFGRVLRDPNRSEFEVANRQRLQLQLKKNTSTPNTPCGTAIFTAIAAGKGRYFEIAFANGLRFVM